MESVSQTPINESQLKGRRGGAGNVTVAYHTQSLDIHAQHRKRGKKRGKTEEEREESRKRREDGRGQEGKGEMNGEEKGHTSKSGLPLGHLYTQGGRETAVIKH